MTRLQSIEQALGAINESVFQELCDHFLTLRNESYAAMSRAGSQTGKQKTIKGTPDLLLLLPSGKYLFVEYSTNISQGANKITADIAKCLDSEKTGIPVAAIQEILVCVNFNLRPEEIEALRQPLEQTRIRLTLYTLDALAIELHLHHRDLVHRYLGLPLDTGQIVSLAQFIQEYERAAKSIATPLDNVFVQRTEELAEVSTALDAADMVILTGPPGIGKTRLVVEAIGVYQTTHPGFDAYAVSYKYAGLLDDLFQYLDPARDHLLFVDDANRIDAFTQIIGFYKATRTGKLKLLVTVRDYAYDEVNRQSLGLGPVRIDLARLSDETIREVISSDSFKIYNRQFQKEIIRIADGNPRLAIMAAKLANNHQRLEALFDVSDLFERYFSTFLEDQHSLGDGINIKCLGLIGFFYTLPYKDREVTGAILAHFGMTYAEFADAIERLDRLELVEVQYEHVKIPEQNLGIYFFYRAFIKDELLSFATLLEHYFANNQPRFRECVISANNTFGHSNVMDKLRPALLKYWRQVQASPAQALAFLDMFWFYLQLETLEYLLAIVNALPEPEAPDFTVTYETNAFSYEQDKLLAILGEYFRTADTLKDGLELAFRYARKLPERLPELIYKIRQLLVFDWRDEEEGFYRQRELFKFMRERLMTDLAFYPPVYFELARTFMAFQFDHHESARHHAISFYRYPLPQTDQVREFRTSVWQTTDEIFAEAPAAAFRFLQSYSETHPDVNRELMAFDVPLLVPVIERRLDPANFEHCSYVQEQIRWCRRMEVDHPRFDELAERFRNPLYELFLKLDWNRLRDKEMFEFDDWREYERLKEADVRSSFRLENPDQVRAFFQDFIFLKKVAKNDWSYNNTLEFVIDTHFQRDFALGLAFYRQIIALDNPTDYVPRLSLKNQLDDAVKAAAIWGLFSATPFRHQTAWQLSFFDLLHLNLVNRSYLDLLRQTVAGINEKLVLHFEGWEKFLSLDPALFQQLLGIIVRKVEAGIEVWTWMDFFAKHFDQLGNDLDLIKTAYLQQYGLQNHFDYELKGLMQIVERDPGFLAAFVAWQYNEQSGARHREHRSFGFVWDIAGISSEIENIFDIFLVKDRYYGIIETYLNVFFRNLTGERLVKADEFLLGYLDKSAADPKKMNLIVDIVRHNRRELFDRVLLKYLTLNQNADDFDKIWWRGNGGTYSGDVIMGDIEAGEWKNIQAVIERSPLGIDLLPIKKCVQRHIESSLAHGDWERRRRFLERD